MAEKKAAEALKGSTVKIRGRDVIASYKVLIGLVLVPIVYSIYSLIVYFYTGSILAAIGTFIALPYFSYATLRVVQEGVVELSFLKSVYTIKKSKLRLGALRKMRADLQVQIRNLVEKLGPETFSEFEKIRIISKEKLEKGTKKSLYETFAYGGQPSYEKLSRRKRSNSRLLVGTEDLPNS